MKKQNAANINGAKPKKAKIASDLEDLIQKYYNASGNEKKFLLAIIKRKKPNFKE